jgi:hypothetical protein
MIQPLAPKTSRSPPGAAPLAAGEVAMERRLERFEDFWPYYLSRHLDPANQALHFLGTSVALVALVAGLTVAPWWLAVLPVAGYGPAWVGHFFFEKNKPATFSHPLWSLRGDLRMYGLLWLHRLEPELARARALYPPLA